MPARGGRADGWRIGRWLLLCAGLGCALAGLILAASWLRDPTHDGWGWSRLGVGLALLFSGAASIVLAQILRLAELRFTRATPATFLAPHEERRVLEAIRTFERRTSGEIRVHLEHHVAGDLLRAAQATMERLGMTGTAQQSGILFFVAVADRRFAVIGDAGIHARVRPEFWTEVATRVEREFAEKRFASGLVAGIELAGAALAEHFPPRPGDVNELSDDLSR